MLLGKMLNLGNTGMSILKLNASTAFTDWLFVLFNSDGWKC